MKESIIVLGGTFNPVHKGHIKLAEKAYELYKIPVLIMPSGDPSSYKKEVVAPSIHRIEMLKLAIRNYAYMSVSELEINRPGKTYTADTLAELKEAYDQIYFIIGADSFFALSSWYKPDYICMHCKLLVAGRNHYSAEEMQQQKNMLEQRFQAQISFLETKDMPYSSTMIRDSIKNGDDIADMVSPAVKEYIYSNHLYLS